MSLPALSAEFFAAGVFLGVDAPSSGGDYAALFCRSLGGMFARMGPTAGPE